MLESSEPALIPQWLQSRAIAPRLQQKKTSGRDVRTIVPCVQPLLRCGPMAEEHGTRPRGGNGGGGNGTCQHRPREFLDERGEVRPSGSRAYLRRTRSEIHCVPTRLITEKSHHTRSPSAWEFMSARRTPDSNHLSSLSSDSGSSCRSFTQQQQQQSQYQQSQQTGRSSRLADLPESHRSFVRHSPESRAVDVGSSARTDFSRLIDVQNGNDDVDAAEIQRIQYEQSKKLIPVVPSRMTPRGRRPSKSPMTPPVGRRSPGSTTPCMAKTEAHSVQTSFGNNNINTNTALKNEGQVTENGFRDPITDTRSKELDRKTFFESLQRNKLLKESTLMGCCHGGHGRGGGSGASGNEIVDNSSCHSYKLVTNGGAPTDMSLVLKQKAAAEEGEEPWLTVGPPSVEEERFLRSLGWNDSDNVDWLTDEEIAAFKAQYLNKTEERGASRQANCKTGDIRSFQCSPVGHLSSFDLVAESEIASMSSETGYMC